MSEAKSWSNTPPCVTDRRQDMAVVFAVGWGGIGGGWGEVTSYKGNGP